MPNDAPTTASSATAPKTNPANLAIGATLAETVGDEGEIVARRNSSFNLDAMGLPRSRFTIVSPNTPAPPTVEEPQETGPKAEEVKPPQVGQDLLSVLGNKAEVYGKAGGTFALEMMNMLFGTIVVGAIMSLGGMAINAVTPEPARPPAGPGARTGTAGNGPDTATPATTAATRTGDEYERPATGQQTPLATVPVAGDDEPATPVAARGGATTRTASATASAASTAPAEPPTTRMMPADTPESDSLKCEAPKPAAPVKQCTTIRPARPGGMG